MEMIIKKAKTISEGEEIENVALRRKRRKREIGYRWRADFNENITKFLI